MGKKLQIILAVAVLFFLFGCTQLSALQAKTDPEIEKLPDGIEKNSAYIDKAFQEKDEAYCYNLSEKNLNECLAVVRKDATLCNARAECFFSLAYYYEEKSFCLQAVDEKLQISCFFAYGLAKKDLSVCNDIEELPLRDACKTKIIEQIGDEKLCSQITDEKLLRYKCFNQFPNGVNNAVERAKIAKDETICEMLPTNIVYSRDYCYEEFAILKIDVTICEKIPLDSYDISGNTYRDLCLREVASAKKDSTICDKIIDEGIKNTCYNRI